MKIAIVVLVAFVLAAVSGRPQNSEPVPIIKYENDLKDDGSYAFNYETGDGIKRSESGVQKEVEPGVFGSTSQGAISWQTPEGKTVTLTFVADERGYQPKITIS